MLNLAYNLSENLKGNLAQIESLRQKILLCPLPRDQELKLRWQALLTQTYFDIAITENKLTKGQLASLAGDIFAKRKLTKDEAEALSVKHALDYVNAYWHMSKTAVTPEAVLYLYKIACSSSRAPKSFVQKRKSLKQALDYIQIQSDHPVIQAAIAHLQIRLISPFDTYNGRVARLTEILFLYKNGMDYRGLLTLNEFWYENLVQYQKTLADVAVSQNMTIWLEFYTQALITQLKKAATAVGNPASASQIPSNFWKLSSRQKDILGILSAPSSSITNRQVQKSFEVSQITAARDLGKLATLNLILKHGRGRSIFYTRLHGL